MDKKPDERRFRDLLVESDDLQSDAMRGARRDLNAYVEAAQEARHESRRDLCVGGAILGAGALSSAALAFASPAMADSAQNIMALQTAVGLENVAVFTYKTALYVCLYLHLSSVHDGLDHGEVRATAQGGPG